MVLYGKHPGVPSLGDTGSKPRTAGTRPNEGISMNSPTHARAAGEPVVEAQTQAFLQAVAAKGGPPIQELSVEDARALLSGAQEGGGSVQPAEVEDLVLPVGPRGRVEIRVVRPRGNAGELPAVLYFHGGGWVLGGVDTHDRLIRELAVGAQAAVIFVNFSRSPESRYPVAIEEAYAALQWVSVNAGNLRVDPARLSVAGDSAGGNLATVLTLLSKERGGPALRFQLLFYPVTDAAFDTPSYRQFGQGYFLTREAMEWFWNQYAPDKAVRFNPNASPLRATMDQLRDLPPALVITGECDVLRDEGEAYARRLSDAGVAVTATRYPGTIHDFVMLNALSQTSAARAALVQSIRALRQALQVPATVE